MRATGIVRKIDNLGRVVIPKEIRRTMGINEGDDVEIFVEDNYVCFKKYDDAAHLALDCAKWVMKNKSKIKRVEVEDEEADVEFVVSGIKYHSRVKYEKGDLFDINVAICYAAKKAGLKVDFLY